MADHPGQRAQWIFTAVLMALLGVLAGIYLVDRLPASTYTDAMARGQYSHASKLLQTEVDNNNPQARNALGNLYYLGMGVERNYRDAALLFHTAASQGFAAAQLNLGHLYRQGLGVDKDVERAFGWYTHARIAGSPWAEYYVSQLSSELTLTPLQMSSARKRWLKLDALSAEPL